MSIEMGCGITAHSYDDALRLAQQRIFAGREIPPVRRVIENVDVSTLDNKHIRPNMAVPVWRGVWFPLGFQ